MNKILVLLAALAVSSWSWAETRYVTDRCEITLRSGQSTGHKIISMLPSGTRLNVVQAGVKGYSKVKTSLGKEGWVLNRMTIKRPVAEQRLAKIKSRMASLKEENRLFNQQSESLVKEQKNVQQELSLCKGKNIELDKELTDIRRTAANTLAIYSENDQLKERISLLETELSRVKKENETFKDESQRNWFMVGAGVLFGGILLGLILPRLRFKKKDSWDSF
ncbi:MAG: TIGR04211 family SH3 domain-containing protein [Gammaproteobacteria bacterium]|nr:TIGR04211 family SH3 domain-containing protein [Gammaproteobacteria bacterium]